MDTISGQAVLAQGQPWAKEGTHDGRDRECHDSRGIAARILRRDGIFEFIDIPARLPQEESGFSPRPTQSCDTCSTPGACFWRSSTETPERRSGARG